MSGWRWHDFEHMHQRVRQPQVSRPSCLSGGRKRESSLQGWLWLGVLCFVWLLIGLSIGLWVAS